MRGPNGIDHLIVRYSAGQASQRGGTCTVLVDALYEGARERSYAFLPDGQFLVNERFGRSPERDSAVSGTRAFFLFPMPRRLILEPRLRGGYLVVRLEPQRVIEVDGRGLLHRLTGAVIEQTAGVTASSEGGVVFRQFDGVLLDAGWARGEVAFRKFPDGESAFTDRAGRTCTVRNREIFSYADPFSPELTFPTDAALGRFLVARCGSAFDAMVLLKGPQRADRSELEPPPKPPPPPRRPSPPAAPTARPPARGAPP